MQKYSEIVATTKADGTVEVLPGATVTVYLTGTTTLASLYSDNGLTAKANPFQSAALTGRIEFYAADGRYDIKIDKAGYTTVTVADILIEDPEDIGILEDVTLVDATISTSTVTNSTLSQCILVNTEIQDVDSLQLTGTPPAVLQPRMLSWNNDEGTADLALLDGTVLQMGQELHYRARNNTASTIADGAVVWATGTSGATGRINVGLAVADGSQPGKTVMGLMTHATAAGSDGYVANFGKVRGINTTGSAVGETWLNGDILYLHPTIPGALTKVKPAVNGHIVVTVAIVIYAGNNGTLFVRPTADSQEADEIRYTPAGTGAVATTVQSKLREFVSVKDFGAKGDGITDDYSAIKAACAAIQANGGGTLVFPEGRTYFVNQHRIDGGANANGITNFVFSSIDGLVIEGNGSKIVMQGGWTRTADTASGGFTYSYQNCIGFEFNSCHNVTIRDLEIDGGAATITKDATAEGFSHGIIVAGCYHFNLENVYVHHYCSDGLIINSSGPITAYKVSRYLKASNCKFTNNARQGCSIIQLRWATFENCEFSYTGQTGTYGGHSPQAGVDIEPDYRHDNPTSPLFIAGDESTGDITFIGCGFVDNNGFEFVATNRNTVQNPVQLFGCSFKNTNNNSPQVATAAKMVRFYACSFENVAWYPGYTFNDDNTTEFYNCFLNWSRDAYGILHASPNPTLRIEGCDIRFTGTSPHGGSNYLIYIQATNAYLRDNNIFYSGALHNGTTYDVVSLIQYVSESRGNRFSTDLTAAGKFFTLAYDAAVYVDDVIVNSGKFSPNTGAYALSNIVAGNKAFSTLLSSGGNKIYYGSAAPTTGNWTRGDKVINTSPSSGGVVEWVCTSGGTPGIWVPTYVNPNESGAKLRTAVAPYASGAFTKCTVAFKGDAASGSLVADVLLAGFNGGTRITVARYGTQTPIVLQNTGGNAIAYSNTGYDGGINMEITISLTNPAGRVEALVGGLSGGFSISPTISFS